MNNSQLVHQLFNENKIAFDLKIGCLPVTLNDLIQYCKNNNISLDSPIFMDCPDGLFPLAYYYESENNPGYLTLADGEW